MNTNVNLKINEHDLITLLPTLQDEIKLLKNTSSQLVKLQCKNLIKQKFLSIFKLDINIDVYQDWFENSPINLLDIKIINTHIESPAFSHIKELLN